MPGPQVEDDRPERPELFISYASGDLDRAAALHRRLAAEGFRVWFDKVRLIAGCAWHKEIEVGCEASCVVLPLITPRWGQSEWTRHETYAHDAVILVLVEGKPEGVIPLPLGRWNAVPLDPLAADEVGPANAGRRHQCQPGRTADAGAGAAYRRSALPANPFFTGRDDDLVRIHE